MSITFKINNVEVFQSFDDDGHPLDSELKKVFEPSGGHASLTVTADEGEDEDLEVNISVGFQTEDMKGGNLMMFCITSYADAKALHMHLGLILNNFERDEKEREINQ